MEVTPTTQAAVKAPKPNQSETVLSSDYETFLKMLTAQMRNQDPLNPVDSSDYAVQLATFSSVEQQVLTNELLTSVQGQLNTMGISQLAGWVGMQAKSESPAHFSGDPIQISTAPDGLADSVQIVVRDQAGAEVYRQAIGTGASSLEWGGINTTGARVQDGLYTFRTESYANGASLGEQPASTYGQVIEARTGSDGLVLVLNGGATVPASDVTALRAPS